MRAGELAATAAIATDASGRHVFLSLNRCDYFAVHSLPRSLEEVRSVGRSVRGPLLTHAQLVARYGGVVLLPIPGMR